VTGSGRPAPEGGDPTGRAIRAAGIRPDAAAAGGRYAARPADIPGRGWLDILRRVRGALGRDHIWLASAGVAYCFLLAAIPGLVVLVALLGLLVGPPAAEGGLGAARGLLPGEAAGFLADQVRGIADAGRLHLGAGLGGALLAALWGARTGVATLVGALNLAYREREARGFLRYQAVAAVATAAACLFGLLALALVAAMPAAEALRPGAPLGAAVTLGRWPGLAVLTAAALAAAYRYLPSRRRARWRWTLPGAVAATGLWLAGSAGFSAYVARFPSYGATLGALGAVMLLLSWSYLTAFAVLLGAELNAEMERQTARDTTEGPDLAPGRRGARVADDLRPGG
jgi:membrane protein